MEWFDVVDESGVPTGEQIERQEAHRLGIRHRTSHIWIIRKDGEKIEVLLQKRSPNKDSFPGQYDTSSAGHIPAGEEPLPAALRELWEELGIDADPNALSFAGNFPVWYEKPFHGEMFRDRETVFVYVYSGNVEEQKLTLQKEEVERVDWFDLKEVWIGTLRGDPRFCVPPGGLEVLMNYLNVHYDAGEKIMEFRKMIAKHNQIELQEAIEILKKALRGVLSVSGDDGYPYGIPLNHWYDEETGKIYFHCGKRGHKIDAIRRSDKASFCVLDDGEQMEGHWALRFRSVVVFGRVRIIDDKEECIEISRKLSYKFTKDEEYIQDEIWRSGNAVMCLELTPEYISGKKVEEK